jgi:hypothetical protein
VKGLPEQARVRLVKLLGMTGSAHDGEALAALRLAQRAAAEHGITLVDVLTEPARTVMAAPPPGPALDVKRLALLEEEAFKRGLAAGRKAAMAEGLDGAPVASWPLLAQRCLDGHPRLLTPWEQEFLGNFLARGWATPTAKQQPYMVKIAAKCGLKAPP